MKKFIALTVLGLIVGCQSTIQDLNNKYINSNKQTQTTASIDKPKNLNHKLFINVTPADANIYITNIEPKFKQGIELPNGDYKIKVTKQGYETVLNTINFNSEIVNKTLNIILKEDALAFKSNKPIKRLTKLDRHGHDYTYSGVWGKGSPSLALAMLMESNNGKVSYVHESVYGDSKLNIETGLLGAAYSNVKKDLAYKKNISFIDKKTKEAFAFVSAKRKEARKNLDTHYVIQIRDRISEEEYVQLYDHEDQTLVIKEDWKGGLFSQGKHNYIKSSKYEDYANLVEIANEIGLRNTYTTNITSTFELSGYMRSHSFKFTGVSYDDFVSGWSRMKRDKWCEKGEKLLEIEVLVKISNIEFPGYSRGGSSIKLNLEPLQARFLPIRKNTTI